MKAGESWRWEGDPHSSIWVVGEIWTPQGDRSNKAFVGDAEVLLKEVLKQKGFSLAEVCFTNVANEVLAQRRVVTPAEFKAFRSKLIEQANIYKPKVIVSCGAKIGSIFIPTSKGLEAYRGTPYWNAEFNAWILPTHHPGGVTYKPETFYTFAADLSKITSVLELEPGGSLIPDFGHTVIRTKEAYQQYKARILQPEDNCMAVDIETDGFDFMLDDILSIGVGPSENHVYIFAKEFIEDPSNHDLLNELLSSKDITYVYQNGKFDVKFLRANPDEHVFGKKKKCVLPNVRCDFDTMMAHYNIDERQGTHGLKVWAAEEFSAPDWDADIEKYLPNKQSKYSLIPEEELYKYQAYDIYYTRKGYSHFLRKMQAEDTEGCFRNIHMPAVEAFTQIELEGIPIDYQRLKTMFDEGQPRIAAAKEKLSEAAVAVGWNPSAYAVAKNLANIKKWEAANAHLAPTARAPMPNKSSCPTFFNPNSHPQLSYVGYDLCGVPLFEGKKTCAKDAVDIYRHRHPFWKVLAEYKEVNDLFGTFIKGMLERVGPDHRIRPDFLLHGTKTGRISCSNPNMQNLPRGSEIKDFFIADPGCVVVNVDYKTLEVMVAAILSGDQDMQKPFIEHLDFHSETTNSVFAKDLASMRSACDTKNVAVIREFLERSLMMEIRHDIEKMLAQSEFNAVYDKIYGHLRFLTKFITFGIMYGRGAQSLAEGELNCSTLEASQYVDMFFAKYPTYKKWLDNQFTTAKKSGYVQNMFGFKRRWPFITADVLHEIRNQSWNTPIQGSASMICMQALCRTQAKLKQLGYGRALFTVHDSIVYSIQKEHLNAALDLIHEELVRPVVETPVQLEVDIEVGPTYKRLDKVSRTEGGDWLPKGGTEKLQEIFKQTT